MDPIPGSEACAQGINFHGEKARGVVLAVKFRQPLPFFANAGADGIVKFCSRLCEISQLVRVAFIEF